MPVPLEPWGDDAHADLAFVGLVGGGIARRWSAVHQRVRAGLAHLLRGALHGGIDPAHDPTGEVGPEGNRVAHCGGHGGAFDGVDGVHGLHDALDGVDGHADDGPDDLPGALRQTHEKPLALRGPEM